MSSTGGCSGALGILFKVGRVIKTFIDWSKVRYMQATSKEDKIKLLHVVEPSVSVATGCVDGSTPMVW